MKKFLAVFVLSIFAISCAKEETGFKGFGDLVLGADFGSIKHADKFEAMSPDEHFILKYELSEELGSVQKVYVTTLNGKIARVKFNTDEFTNIDAVTKSYNDLQAYKPDMSMMPRVELDFFVAKDSSVMLGITKNPPFSSAKKNNYQFMYIDKNQMEIQAKKLANR